MYHVPPGTSEIIHDCKIYQTCVMSVFICWDFETGAYSNGEAINKAVMVYICQMYRPAAVVRLCYLLDKNSLQRGPEITADSLWSVFCGGEGGFLKCLNVISFGRFGKVLAPTKLGDLHQLNGLFPRRPINRTFYSEGNLKVKGSLLALQSIRWSQD